jgi:hypothetical protein
MMKMLLTGTFVLFIVSVSFAQVDIGFFAGPQMSTARFSVAGVKQSTSSKYGFHLGTTLKIPFENRLNFAPSVFYSLKGYDVTLKQPSLLPDTSAINNSTTIHTAEIAALFQYDFKMTGNRFFIRFGPSIDVQLSGKEKFNRKNGTTVDRGMTFSYTRYGRFGANVITALGYEMTNGVFFTAQYIHGIGSVANADYGPNIHHRVYGLSVGKYFIHKK